MFVKGMLLRNQQDIEKIIMEVVSGNVIVFNFGDLLLADKTNNIVILLGDLKQECDKRNFDMGKLGLFRGVVTPEGMKVWRDS